ncbi:Zn-ribbon domain-containing protein [Salinigranum marinum]|uniref:Zn-ribbon domain-containing protein n=1 Tax=Salinigranum marinum TaxID=1515595 RepID=UPI002989C1B9|nr:Zn-ribbon containing protein [Salinigranum marinum]
MPHQCTNCERVFADGSKEMLSGCPDCGGNKFQFQPSSATATGDATEPDDATPPADDQSGSDPAPPSTASNPPERSSSDPGPHPDPDPASASPTSARQRPTADSEASTGSSAPSSSTTPPADGTDADTDVERRTDTPTDGRPPAEDNAQASARTDMVSPDELADAATDRSTPPTDDVDGRVIEPQSDDRPGLDELREELNSQFESIKIVSPGQYELNLMELYDRQEYIISLQEDGRYVIEVPDSWGDRDGE